MQVKTEMQVEADKVQAEKLTRSYELISSQKEGGRRGDRERVKTGKRERWRKRKGEGGEGERECVSAHRQA